MMVARKARSHEITKITRDQDRLYLQSEVGRYRFELKSSKTVRITYTCRNEFSSRKKPGVINQDVFEDWSYEKSEENVVLKTSDLQLKINLKTASIQYLDGQGNLLLKEKDSNSRTLEEFTSYKLLENDDMKVEKVMTVDGAKDVVREAARVPEEKLFHTRWYLQWQPTEALYGLGQQEEGFLNLRGQTIYLHQANRKIAIPFFVSSLGYGVLTDTYSPLIFNDTVYGSYIYTEADDELDQYFIYGGSPDGTIAEYRRLTGKAVMLPKWAFGYIQSQERFEDADELVRVEQEYRKRNIGLDGIVLDWCSWVDNQWGQKTLDPNRFPDPEGMTEQLHKDHVHFMISVWPNMSNVTADYKEFKDNHLLLPGSEVYNALSQEGRDLYWKQAEKNLYSKGVDAWWCDSSEPFTPEWNHFVRTEPSKMFEEYCKTVSDHMPDWSMNAFSLYHAQALYDGQRGTSYPDVPGKRVVNLTRSAYTGQQRFGTILWSGDISASWDTLRKQIASGLNFCASGLPYWTVDIGAFFVKDSGIWFWDGDYNDGYDDLGYRELFVRWYQWGCFLPVFRGHGTDIRRELWNFGNEGEKFYDALILTNHLRYELMPYIYSLAGNVYLKDASIMRPLAFEFTKDQMTYEIKDQYMFGNIMVCPVTTPMYYEKESKPINEPKVRKVYLPEGCGWYDYWTNEYYQGGQWIEANAPLDKIPLYVEEGTILPKTVPALSVEEMNQAIDLYVYEGIDATFDLYEDAGDGYDYEKGEYTLTHLSWSQKELKLSGDFDKKGKVVIIKK